MGKLNNRGSQTVEMSLVMPIVLFVMAVVIYIFFRLICMGDATGKGYMHLYTYQEDECGEIVKYAQLADSDIKIGFIGPVNDYSINANERDGDIMFNINLETNKYNMKTEYNLCSDRLRRWQFYGDVICE